MRLFLLKWLGAAVAMCGATVVVAAARPASIPVITEDSATHLMVAAAHPRAALVIFPGAYLSPQKYLGLAQAVVTASQGEIAVFVPHFLGDFANPLEANGRVQEAIGFLTEQGVAAANKHVFVAGHSFGGIIASDMPQALALPGLVLLGSYLPHTAGAGKYLRDYAYPTLTLGAELDGLTGLNYLAREADVVRELALGEPDATLRKPVIVLRGINHMGFADGSALDGDTISSEVALASGHQLMATTIVGFMAAQGALEQQSAAEGAQVLKDELAATAPLLTPYRQAQLREEATCSELQRAVAPLAGTGWERLDIEAKIYQHGADDLAFLFDKSSIAKTDSGYRLHLPVQIDRELDPLDLSKDNYLAPRALLCKMRSLDKISSETGYGAGDGAKNCAQLNAKVIVETLATIVDPQQRARIEARYGAISSWRSVEVSDAEANQVVVGPFTIRSEKQSIGPAWVGGTFSFEKAGGSGWSVDTVELVTAKDVAVEQLAGANYCKVIAPARVVEWATLFGLK